MGGERSVGGDGKKVVSISFGIELIECLYSRKDGCIRFTKDVWQWDRKSSRVCTILLINIIICSVVLFNDDGVSIVSGHTGV